MAKTSSNIASVCSTIVSDCSNKVFKPVYLLMGEESYYPDLVCSAIMENCLDEFERDFNETILYGAETNARDIVTAARRYPMMAERQLVVVKEAQLIKNIEELAVYCAEPLDTTVLVLLFHGGGPDKRKALFKSIAKCGAVVDSPLLKDYEVPDWISSYYASRGLDIEPSAANLLAEHAGASLSKIAIETDKLLKNLPEGSRKVSVADIERNVGISRQYSIFELTKELSSRNAPRALVIASHIGNAAKFAMPMAVSALYTHFYRILRYGALLEKNPHPTSEQKTAALAGVNPYFYREYDTAVRNYPPRKAMGAISLLCEFDYLGKGGDGAAASQSDLMMELCAKLLNL